MRGQSEENNQSKRIDNSMAFIQEKLQHKEQAKSIEATRENKPGFRMSMNQVEFDKLLHLSDVKQESTYSDHTQDFTKVEEKVVIKMADYMRISEN